MKNEEMITASVKLRKKDDALIKKLALAKGNISKSAIIRIAITDYIQQHKHLINEENKGELQLI